MLTEASIPKAHGSSHGPVPHVSIHSISPHQISTPIITVSGAHNPEHATPLLGLCQGVFTDRFNFRRILGQFFPRKWNLRHVYKHIRSIKYQKVKLSVIKRQKLLCLGL